MILEFSFNACLCDSLLDFFLCVHNSIQCFDDLHDNQWLQPIVLWIFVSCPTKPIFFGQETNILCITWSKLLLFLCFGYNVREFPPKSRKLFFLFDSFSLQTTNYRIIAPSGSSLGAPQMIIRCVCVVVTIRRWADVGLWVAVSSRKLLFVGTLDTITGNLAVNSVFITIRSMRDANKFHFFLFFRNFFLNIITVSFPMVIKRSPGGEAAGGGWSTSKSTCVVPAWTLTSRSENASFGVCASQWSHQLTSDPRI